MADDKKEEKKGGKEEGEETAPAPAAGGSKKKLFIAIGGVLVLLLAIGIPVVMMTLKKEAPKEMNELSADAATEGHEEHLNPEGAGDEEELAEGEEPLGAIFPLETFVVNLSGGRYVRCQMQFEFMGRDVPKKFYSRLVPLRDALIGLLAARTAETLGTEGGRAQLKVDAREIANEILKKQEIKNVYFTQFVIQ